MLMLLRYNPRRNRTHLPTLFYHKSGRCAVRSAMPTMRVAHLGFYLKNPDVR